MVAAAIALLHDQGLLDSLLCGDNNYRDVPLMISEMRRVLAPGGTYLVVSHGQPSSRMRFLHQQQQQTRTDIATVSSAAANKGNSSRSFWSSIECVQIPRPPAGASSSSSAPSSFYYMYVCRKA